MSATRLPRPQRWLARWAPQLALLVGLLGLSRRSLVPGLGPRHAQRAAAREASPDEGMDAFDALDLNKDGVISREEFLQARRAPPDGPGDVQRLDVPCLEGVAAAGGRDGRDAEFDFGAAQTMPLRGVLGGSVYAKTLRKQVSAAAKEEGSVIIFGEPGTKKDMLAFLIHFQRLRRVRRGRLLFVDSGTVSSLGVRIFGRTSSAGLLDSVPEGTLIFNNVHRLNRKLLPSVVQLANNGTYWSRKFKEMRTSKLKVILISEDQFEELKSLSCTRIKVPALRVRRADIESMVKYKLRILSRLEGKQVPMVEPQALKRLQAYDYPNNVQELFSMIENAWCHYTDGGTLTADMVWTAQSPEKLDMFKVNLLDVYPSLRSFLQSNWLEQLNHGFTKYVFVALNLLLWFGPQTRDANFGLNIFWAWWWPGILLTYPVLGRFWCAVCPFMIFGEVVQRARVAGGAQLRKWPQEVERYGGWFLYALFLAILMWEELWVLEDTAYLSSCLLLLITFGAMVGSYFYERRIWCRHLCPIGGMNGLYAKMAVTELRAQNGQCKAVCNTFHCYKGGPEEGEGQETDGCPLYSHPANLKDNKNCVLCFTCLRACPHRNVQLNLRAPGVDFGFPFLFPIPGTNMAAQHEPSMPEVALLFLLLGAVVCHHLEDLLLQVRLDLRCCPALCWRSRVGESPERLESFSFHAFLALAALLAPGLLAAAFDQLARRLCALFEPDRKPPNEFVKLAYSYLPLTWLGSLAHYLQLGLVEAGQVLPTAARTVEYFVRQLPGQEQADMQWLHEVEQRLPSVSFAPDVVAFLQGICIILAALFSLQLLNKLGGKAPYIWIHQLVMLAFSWELWLLLA
ncbi:unnamed protein product [Durusdinium trenchii]|uniref:Uncharacterized protein n=1 Tax=Durusdinium trenchii TaxID=1381693 RepID=A0ABP0PCX5_9DINO